MNNCPICNARLEGEQRAYVGAVLYIACSDCGVVECKIANPAKGVPDGITFNGFNHECNDGNRRSGLTSFCSFCWSNK